MQRKKFNTPICDYGVVNNGNYIYHIPICDYGVVNNGNYIYQSKFISLRQKHKVRVIDNNRFGIRLYINEK